MSQKRGTPLLVVNEILDRMGMQAEDGACEKHILPMDDLHKESHADQILQQELAKARRECAELAEENAHLRRLLGQRVGATTADQRSQASAPISGSAPPSATVHDASGLDEKISLFRSLFRGREDVYPIFWENRQTGRKGYVPAIRGGWTRSRDSSVREYLPLTDEVVRQHLIGEVTIGVYPLLPDDTCWFLACDFDGKPKLEDSHSVHKAKPSSQNVGGVQESSPSLWALEALTYLAVCERHGIPAYVERSRSGQGAHLWVFFSEPIQAVQARRLGTWLLREMMVDRAELDPLTYDRLFPSQDILPKGGLGNLIALPLQPSCRAQGNSEFVDAEFRSVPDQWAFLSRIKRLSRHEVERLVTQAPPVTMGPCALGTTPVSIRRQQPIPGQVSGVLDASLSIEKTGLPSWLMAELKHAASVHNPVFYERQKLRLSTHRTPRFIRCYDEDFSHVHLPRGILEQVHLTVREAGGDLALTDLRPTPDPVPLSFHGSLNAAQQRAIKPFLFHDSGVLDAPPGAGKTVMACLLVAHRSLPTLVLVHRRTLLEQWRKQLAHHLRISPDQIGEISSGKNRTTGIVDIAMIQTLKNLPELSAFLRRYGLLIADECHHIPAFSFESCVKHSSVRFLLGLTATPYRRDGLQDLIMMQCGPIRSRFSQHDRSAQRVPVNVRVRDTTFTCPTTDDTSIQDVFRALIHHEERTQAIVSDVLDALDEGRRCLILSEWKEHCRILYDRLIHRGKTPSLLVGGPKTKARLALEEAQAGHKPTDEWLIVATGQYLGEGFDCPEIDTLFLPFPIAFKGKVAQYTGRILRQHPTKEVARIYDYADLRIPVLKHMHAKRIKAYERLGLKTRGRELRNQQSLWDE